MPPPTPARVARWMIAEVKKRGFLSEKTAALEIFRLFDGPFVREKPGGELSVGSNVLRALRRIAGDEVTWDGTAHGWRLA
ncbi:MAG: DUF6953 family protein [Polyangiaceae bacterium]